MSLTVAKVDSLKHSGKRSPDLHCDGDGLYLKVQKSGAKSWLYRFKLNGVPREMGLGTYPAFSLATARTNAEEQRKLVQQSIDPIRHRDEQAVKQAALEAADRTFDQCVVEFFADKGNGLGKNEKHRAQWKATLETYASPKIGSIPVQLITMLDIKRVLKPIWETKTETASRVRARIEKVLGWAKAHGFVKGDNVAMWKGNLDAVFTVPKKVNNFPSLPYPELPAFMVSLRALKDHDAPTVRTRALALEFAILNASRTGEVRGAKWAEFDLAKRMWTIPASRMKMEKEHRVPLSDRSLEILQAQPREGEFVFPGLHENALLNVLETLGRTDITVHGFRSTFRIWGAEETTYERDMLEFAMAHKVAEGAEEAYLRNAQMVGKRRQLMADWADYCAGIVPERQLELPANHPARIAYEKAMREMLKSNVFHLPKAA